MFNRVNMADAFARMMKQSREDAGETKIHMAKAMRYSTKSIENWEYGIAAPNFLVVLEWFAVLHANPLHYLLPLLFPGYYGEDCEKGDIEAITRDLHHYIDNVASPREKRLLAFNICGRTGSMFRAQLEMLTANNHNPLKDRVNAAQNIKDSYDMNEARGTLVAKDGITPDMQLLDAAIKQGKEAYITGKDEYWI